MHRPMQGNSSSSGGLDQDVEREAAARGGSASSSSSAPGFNGTEKAQVTGSPSEKADHTNAISVDHRYAADDGEHTDHSHSQSHEDKEIHMEERRRSHSLQRQRSLTGNSTTMSLKPGHDNDDASSSSSGSNSFVRAMNKTSKWLGNYRIESVSIAPVRLEARTQKKWWSVGLLWLSANHNCELVREERGLEALETTGFRLHSRGRLHWR